MLRSSLVASIKDETGLSDWSRVDSHLAVAGADRPTQLFRGLHCWHVGRCVKVEVFTSSPTRLGLWDDVDAASCAPPVSLLEPAPLPPFPALRPLCPFHPCSLRAHHLRPHHVRRCPRTSIQCTALGCVDTYAAKSVNLASAAPVAWYTDWREKRATDHSTGELNSNFGITNPEAATILIGTHLVMALPHQMAMWLSVVSAKSETEPTGNLVSEAVVAGCEQRIVDHRGVSIGTPGADDGCVGTQLPNGGDIVMAGYKTTGSVPACSPSYRSRPAR